MTLEIVLNEIGLDNKPTGRKVTLVTNDPDEAAMFYEKHRTVKKKKSILKTEEKKNE